MADLKISQLTALTSIDAASTDVFPIVDTSATTTKKISLADVTEFVNDAIVFPAGVEDLDDLGDVAAPSPSNGDVLKYNGTAWVNDAGYATLDSPTFTGTPAAPTAAVGTSSTQVATTAFVMNSTDNDQFVLSAAIFTS